MTAIAVADRVREFVAAAGTAPFPLAGTPVADFRSFLAAFGSTSQLVAYVADDLAGNWETGYGTFNGSNQLSRNNVFASTNGGALVNFTGQIQVFCSPLSELTPQLDTNGNLVVKAVVPRTNTLASLLALVGEPVGEIASATDQPAVVQYGAWGAALMQPWRAMQSVASTNAAASTVTVNPLAEIIRVAVGAAATTLVVTINNGYVDGQPIEIEIPPTTLGLTSITAGAAVLSNANGNLPNTLAIGVGIELRWRASDSTWQCRQAYELPPQVPFSMAFGVLGSAPNATDVALNGATFGSNTTAVGYKSQASATGSIYVGSPGSISAAIGTGSIGIGSFNSTADGATASAPFAIGAHGEAIGGISPNYTINPFFTTTAGGAWSYADRGAQTGGPNWNSATLVASTGLSLSLGTYTATVASGAPANGFFETGCQITVTPGVLAKQSYSGVVTATTTTSISFTLTEVPSPALVSPINIYNCSPGQCASAVGLGAVALNFGDSARSNAFNNNPGDAQEARIVLSGLTSSAAALVLTSSGLPVGAGVTQVGNATATVGPRFVVQPSQAVFGKLRLLGKLTGSANVAYGEWNFVAVRNGSGAPSITGVQAVGTPTSSIAGVVMPATPGTGNPTAGASVTISGNSTYESVEVAVFGASSAVGWVALLDRVEAIEA